MLVYRYCSQQEIDEIFRHHNFDKIGCMQEIDPFLNTHQYSKNVYYMHFFLAEDSLFYSFLLTNYCICVYEIPDELIDKYQGMGYYANREGKKKDGYYLLESVRECAIPSQLMRLEYLRSVDILNGSPIYEDYLKGLFPYFLDKYYFKDEKDENKGYCYQKQK